MIQRIQSFWLFLAAACACLTFKLPFYVGTTSTGIQSFELKATDNLLILLITIAVILMALFTIFLFKKRVVQIRLCIVGVLLQALLIFLYYKDVKTFTTGSYTLWSILQGGVLVFFIMAARGISRDEKLVKQSDRLR